MKRMTMKEYVDSRFKRIQDSINNYANGKDVDQIELLDDNISVEEINNKVKRLTAHGDVRNKVKPEDIILDANHRFINDIQEEKIKESVTRTDLEAAERDITNNLKLSINQTVDNLINDKDAIDAINKIKKVISKNHSTIDLFKNLIDKDDLNAHEKNGNHISWEDRAALNLLLKFIDKGCADWNAKEGDANYVRNKPKSLPANGGNADTVGNYKPEDLFNKQLAKCIIGIDNNNKNYSKKDVNILLNKNNVNTLNTYLCDNSLTYIREGYYNINEFKMPVNSNVSGVGVSTQIDNCKANINNNSKLHDIYFTNSEININCNESEITDTTFKNCRINLSCSRAIIKECRFIDCAFINQKINNSIIKDNICSGTTNKIEYYGGNNIISNLYI